jgi:hypothetical protein
MHIKPIITLLILTTISFICLSALLQFARFPNEHPNGFIRNIDSKPLVPVKQLVLTEPLQEICGATSNHIYFTVPNPQLLISLDIELKKKQLIFWGLKNIRNIIGAYSVVVDSPTICFFANNIPALYLGKIGEKKIDTIKLNSVFTRSTLSSQHYVILRALVDTQTQSFQKVDIRSGKKILERKVVGQNEPTGLESDGLLKYDKITGNTFFVEYYRNHFYCIDSDLNLIYNGRTIDTTSTNKVESKIINIEDEKRLMPSNPRTPVNKKCVIENGRIFILAGLKADNEKSQLFRSNSLIDVYNQKTGKYKESFYIPDIDKEKVKSFIVKNKLLIALYEKYVVVYYLNLSSYTE